MSNTKVARAKRDAEGNILTEQVTPEVQAIIQQWALDHADDLNERLEPLGLGNYSIVGPTYRQVVIDDKPTTSNVSIIANSLAADPVDTARGFREFGGL